MNPVFSQFKQAFQAITFHLKKSNSHFIFACLATWTLSGCTSNKTLPYPPQDDILQPLQMYLVVPQPLPVMAWTSPPVTHRSNTTVRIYIEGDGRAWVRRGRPATDPTPQNRLVHYLMKEDPKSDIAYLGRPMPVYADPGLSPPNLDL